MIDRFLFLGILIFTSLTLNGQSSLTGRYCQGKCGGVILSWIDFRLDSKFQIWFNNPKTKDYDIQLGFGNYQIVGNEIQLIFSDPKPISKPVIKKIDDFYSDSVEIKLVILDNLIKDTVFTTVYLITKTGKSIPLSFTSEFPIKFAYDETLSEILLQMMPFKDVHLDVPKPGKYIIEAEMKIGEVFLFKSTDKKVFTIKSMNDKVLILYDKYLKTNIKYYKS